MLFTYLHINDFLRFTLIFFITLLSGVNTNCHSKKFGSTSKTGHKLDGPFGKCRVATWKCEMNPDWLSVKKNKYPVCQRKNNSSKCIQPNDCGSDGKYCIEKVEYGAAMHNLCPCFPGHCG